MGAFLKPHGRRVQLRQNSNTYSLTGEFFALIRNLSLDWKRILTLLLPIYFIVFLGCNKSVQNQSVNESAPTGTLIFQGTFTGANGKTCSGSCKIYQSTSNPGVFFIRLESVTIQTDGTSADLVSTINGTDTNIADLNVLTGSKNYTYNPGVGAYTFTSTKVKRRSDGTVYCEALLAAVP